MRAPLSTLAVLGGILLGIAMVARLPGLDAATQKKQEPAGQIVSDEQMEAIQRRFDKIAEHHQQLLELLEEISAELQIVKVRVTR